jgi:8-oxo-dGTP pyrophosphatase MutT (NUDIX family)
MQGFLLKIWRALKLPTGLQLFFMRLVNDRFLVGVTGIFFDEEKRVLLVKHTYRGEERWSLPGGYAKAGEHPKETLEREVKEETGYVVSADEKSKIRTDRDTARLDITYVGVFIGGVFTPSHEVKEAKLFKFKDLPVLPSNQLMFIDKALTSTTS